MEAKPTYIVAVYLVDRAFGGHEEGGWWYDTGQLVRIHRTYKDQDRARAKIARMNRLLDATVNKGRREISSVLSDGRYYAEVHENAPPAFYPEHRPHYE